MITRKISFFLAMILLFFLFGCKEENSNFDTENEAKEYLFKEEELRKENIVDEFRMGSNYLIIFEKDNGEERAFGFINFILLEDDSIILDDISPKLSIDGTEEGRFVGLEHQTTQGRIINFSIGMYDGLSYEEIEKNIEKGILSIDEDRGIYYAIDIED